MNERDLSVLEDARMLANRAAWSITVIRDNVIYSATYCDVTSQVHLSKTAFSIAPARSLASIKIATNPAGCHS